MDAISRKQETMNLSPLLPRALVESHRESMRLLASIPKLRIGTPVLYSNLLDMVRTLNGGCLSG